MTFAIEFNYSAGAFIRPLFDSCSPAAILGRVPAIVVDTVDRMRTTRTSPHIGKESFKRGFPASANLDAAPAVGWVTVMFRVIATLTHHLPHGEFWRMCKSVGLPALPFQATTTLRISGPKATSENACFLAAVTKTTPENILMFIVPGASDNGESSVSVAGQVNEWRHTAILT
jgi:hypothetical protein